MSYFLISNDDGVLAPGLEALVEAVGPMGDYQVVAPSHNCSGYSNALTLNRPLRPSTLPNGYISVDGTPADCVHLAINGLLEQQPQMVLSGVNAGANLGDDVLYSGTVAAAMEGRFLGKPAMALSLLNPETEDFTVVTEVVQYLIRQWDNIPVPQRSVLNVNIPDLPWEQIQGFKVTRLGHRGRANDVKAYIDPRGKKGYWLGVAGMGEDAGPGTDFHAISEGFVSVTPLHMDMTKYDVMEELSAWLEGI